MGHGLSSAASVLVTFRKRCQLFVSEGVQSAFRRSRADFSESCLVDLDETCVQTALDAAAHHFVHLGMTASW